MSNSAATKAAEAGVLYFPPPPTTEATDLKATTSTNSSDSSNLYPPPPCPPPSQASSIPNTEAYYPPPPPGLPPAQTTTSTLPTIPTYNPALAEPFHPLKSNPSPTYNPTAAAAATAVPASSGPIHPDHFALPDPTMTPPKTAEQVDAETAEPKSPFSKWGKKLHAMGAQAANPINSLANKIGVQAFLPATMDRECEKAADILLSFTKSGVVADKPIDSPDIKHPKESKSLLKIPPKVLASAHGLVIFTAVRAGFQFAGSTGSGVLIARLPDGSWSAPSGIQVASLGGGFLVGLEVFDCVLIINSPAALAAFLRTRVSLGPEVAVAAGPYGIGGGAQVGHGAGPRGERGSEEVHPGVTKRPASPGLSATGQAAIQAGRVGAGVASPEASNLSPGPSSPTTPTSKKTNTGALKPVFSYVKSKGFYAGVQVDGTVIIERKDANAAFYGRAVGVDQIIRGMDVDGRKVEWPASGLRLLETLRMVERLPVDGKRDGNSLGPAGNVRPGSGFIAGEELPKYEAGNSGYPVDVKVKYQ